MSEPPDPIFLATAVEIVLRAGDLQNEGRASGFRVAKKGEIDLVTEVDLACERMDLEVNHPGVKQSMLKALTNVMPRHLLDTRLNPSGELRDSAALRLDEAAASSLIQIQH